MRSVRSAIAGMALLATLSAPLAQAATTPAALALSAPLALERAALEAVQARLAVLVGGALPALPPAPTPPAWRGPLPARAFDGAAPLAASLLAVRADERHAELRWQTPAGVPRLTVYRRDAHGDWAPLAEATADGARQVTCVDSAVAAGARYAYCLGAGAGGAEAFGGEARVEIPGEPPLAVRALRADAAAGGAQVTFSLPDDSYARVEVVDATGQRRWERAFAPAAPGEQVLRVESARPLVPGVYVVRLAQGPRLAMARVTLAR